MAVTIPPWLNLDPIAPARIRLQANQQRNAADASVRQAQAQAQDLQFRRERAAAQDAAQERAEQRREKVFQQTQDQELAQAAQQMQMRREAQAEKTRQFEQSLRIKQQEAEREAKSAAQQMQGMKAVEKGLQAGEPLQKLISENAPLLFARHPERMPSAVPRGITGPPTLIDVKDEAGNPTGIKAIPGRGGSMNVQRPQGLTARDRLMADKTELGFISSQLSNISTEAEAAPLKARAKVILERMNKAFEQPATPGLLPPRPTATNAPTQVPLSGPSAASPVGSAPLSDKVHVKGPDGPGWVPRAQWEAASEAERKGWEVIEDVAAEEEDEEPVADEEQ